MNTKESLKIIRKCLDTIKECRQHQKEMSHYEDLKVQSRNRLRDKTEELRKLNDLLKSNEHDDSDIEEEYEEIKTLFSLYKEMKRSTENE